MLKWWRALKTRAIQIFALARLRARVLFDTLYLRFFVKHRLRPAPIDIRFHFAAFVRQYGGEVCDDTPKSQPQQPKIADYIFRSHSVIAELKSLEVDPFDLKRNPTRLFDELRKSGMTDDQILNWILHQEKLSDAAVLRMRTIFQRQIETIARKARDQIQSSMTIYNIPDASGLLLIANDSNYLFNFPQKLALISDVMARHFNHSCIHCVVFFSPNVPTRVAGSLREWHPWHPSYGNKAKDSLVDFVNDLGHHWGQYFFSLSGETPPDIKISDPEVGMHWLATARNVDVRRPQG